MKAEVAIITFRLTGSVVFAGGAIWLASKGLEGWGWCVFASLFLGDITYSTKDGIKD